MTLDFLNLILSVSKCGDFDDLYRGYYRKIFTDVCLRLVAASDLERNNLIYEDPEEFVAISLDACDEQK